jgi:transcriptional regulator with XRE-family HTH domain
MFRLKDFREKKNLSQKDVAVLLGCKQPNIADNEKDEKDLTEAQLNIISDKYGKIYVMSFIDKNHNKDDENLPLIPVEFIAGYGEENSEIKLNDCERYNIPEFKKIGAEFLVRVGDSSMYPKYSSGDILACKKIPKQNITFFQWGKIYVIDSAQGQLIKRIFEHQDSEKVWLVSDYAENYPKFSINKNDIRSLSIVLGVVKTE